MPVDVIMPALGMAQETGKVLRWLRAEGDDVPVGTAIAVVLAAGEPVPSGHVRSLRPDMAETGMASVTEVERPGRARRALAAPKARRPAGAKGLQIAEIR